MARRIATLTLVSMLALAVGSNLRAAAPTPNVLRIDLGDGGTNAIVVNADETFTWKENDQRIVACGGHVLITQGKDFIRAERAIVWVDIDSPKSDNPTRGVIYVDGGVQATLSEQTQNTPSALVNFYTRGQLQFTTKKEIQNRSLKETALYQLAWQSRQPPLEADRVPSGIIIPSEASASTAAKIVTADVKTPNENGVVNADLKMPQTSETELVAVQATAPTLPAPDPVPGSRGGPPTIEPPTFETPEIPLPNVSSRRLRIAPRSGNPTNFKFLTLATGEQIALVTGGVKLLAIFPDNKGQQILDIEADQLVIWQKGGKQSDLADVMRSAEGVNQDNDKEREIYLTGNVVMRFGSSGESRNPDGSPVENKVMRAEQVYYDVTHNKAIAIKADLEMARSGVKQAAHFEGEEIWQLSPEEFIAKRSRASASVLPADPGLDLWMRDVTITEEKETVRRNIFGLAYVDRFTGEEEVTSIRRYRARHSILELAGIPVGYFPVLSGNVDNPTGPLKGLGFRSDRIFGSQYFGTWSVLDLIGVKRLPNENWSLMTDYLSKRGPGIGSVYDLAGNTLFGVEAPFATHILGYAIDDKGYDILGGPRETAFTPTQWRGRAQFRHVQTYENWSFQGQAAYLSDRNYVEAYYNQEWNLAPNQETFAYLKYQEGNGAATILAEPNLNRPWVTESQWLPKLEGQWLGQSFFDLFTYNTWGSAAYAKLQTFNTPLNEYPSTVNPLINPTNELPINTGRFDWMQQLSMPFSAGFLRITPYANVDLTYYTKDNEGNSDGRFYGGGGTRVSMPLTRLYSDAESELFNIRGINHKMTLSGNYYNAYSNTPSNLLPQLDRLYDDATQQSLKDIKPWEPNYRPGITGDALYTAPLYDPRLYAIRRLVDTRVDTLDTIQVVQADLNQRWQTKRGYPGMEHTVDYLTLDLSASFFPAKNRDNFGNPVSFLEYNAMWATGDRNGFTSSGWFDPFDLGTKYWNIGTYFTRPDGTTFSANYRDFEPIGSKVISGSIAYRFSPKYSVNFGGSYDLNIASNQSTSLTVTRTGTDLTWSLGFTYNAILNNLGVNFLVVPNLLYGMSNTAPTSLLGTGSSGQGRQ